MKLTPINRIGLVSFNTIRQTLISVFAMLIPFLVIFFSSKEIWGEFVSLLLFTLLAIQFINWGNKEYLLRTFSETPSQIAYNFTSVLITRLPLVILFTLIGLFSFKSTPLIYLFLWLFGRYLIHSFEVLVIYEKKFAVSIGIEILCFSFFLVSFFSFKSHFNFKLLLILYSLYQLTKGVLYLILFKHFLNVKKVKFDFNYFKISFWFFLLSVIGFLGSKIDVYIIESFGKKIITSDYQIINSLLVFIMSIASFIYTPFTKNLYRNNALVISKTQTFISILGLIIVPFTLLISYFIIFYFLKIDFSFFFFFICFFYVYPSYIYGIEIVSLFKEHKEKKVIIILSIGIITNFILSYLFLYFNFSIYSALLGSSIAQFIVLILFKINKNG